MEDEGLLEYHEEQDFSHEFSMDVWRKTGAYAIRHKKRFFTSAIYMVLDSGVDVIFPLTTMYAIDTFIVSRDMSSFLPFAFFYVGMIVVQSLAIMLFISTAGAIEAGVIYNIRKEGFAKLQSLSFSYYDRTPVGWIIARITSDVQRMGDIVAWGVIDIMWTISMVIILVGVMFALNTQLALLLLATVPALCIASFLFQKKIIKAQREVRKSNSKITGSINEGIIGARTTKTLVREEGNLGEFCRLTKAMRDVSVRSSLLSAAFLPTVTSLSSIGLAMVLTAGGNQMLAGSISLGTLAVFAAYSLQMFQPLQHIAHIFSDMQSAQASAERTFSLMETKPDVIDRPDVVARYGDIDSPKPQHWEGIVGEVVFEGVSFAYCTYSNEGTNNGINEGKLLLDNFNLRVRAGEKVALVGETGAGKSTIVNLLCRFYEPTAGRILIDGVDYRERSQGWLHAQLGYVLQTPHLFSGSIMENIRYSSPEAGDEEVEEAARRVGAYGFIMRMEKGFDSDVGEGGARLSTGERQLVSFARAILRDPSIFVLDEATSSIDAQTETIIQAAVDEALRGRTSFIIAHRLSTIRGADRILVINDGHIVEDGSHCELLRRRGHYHSLYTKQAKIEAQLSLLET